jgi:MoaA/NifB/PqqE/SkfB family radical SAM enzyme
MEKTRLSKPGLLNRENLQKHFYLFLLKKSILSKFLRGRLFKFLDKRIHKHLMVINPERYPKEVQLRKYHYTKSMILCSKRNLDKGLLSRDVVEKMIDNFVSNNFFKRDKMAFEKRYGTGAPLFVVLSPTHKCNLLCEGCYASSKMKAPQLPFHVTDKIFDQVYNEFGNRFMVISGGEPFMYKEGDRTIFDLWEKYPGLFFMMYTNGTMITQEVAEKLAELGNVTPAISIEGFEKETDARRGKGVFKKILQACEHLKKAGVPFGVSVTATTKNFDTIMKDEFWDWVFQELGATYAWLFQIMPIGQAKHAQSLMIPPKQRIKLYRKWEYLLREKHYCVADFWNSGVLSNGCIAYGKKNGYFYIDWNGNIMPCAFVPYFEDNVIDLFEKRKRLGDALNSPLFKRGRKWQDETNKDLHKPDNWLMPCSIRDHWSNWKKNILTKTAKPEDVSATALKTKEYSEFLENYDKELEEITQPIWENEFLDKD